MGGERVDILLWPLGSRCFIISHETPLLADDTQLYLLVFVEWKACL